MTTPDRERDRRSLQDLARLAQVTPPPASVAPSLHTRGVPARSEEDSGLIDLAAASLADPQAAARAQSTPLASAGLFDDVVPEGPVAYRPVSQPPLSAPASLRPSGPASALAPVSAPPSMPVAPPSVASTRPSAPASAPVVAAAIPASPLSAPRVPALATAAYAAMVLPKKPSKRLLAAGIVGVLALVGGGLFAYRQAQTTATPVAGPAIEAPKRLADEDIPLPENTAQQGGATEGATAATAIDELPATEADTLDPNALPEAHATRGHTATRAAKGASTPARASAQTSPKATKTPASAKADEGKLTASDLPPSTGTTGALGDEMRKAVGDNGREPSPAAAVAGPQFAAGTVPQKPSQGAVTSAVSAVLPSARGCLGPDDPISRAAVVFESVGSVQTVRVSGGAAGKPAEHCIQSALGKAKIAPFAEPTYTVNVTVRP